MEVCAPTLALTLASAPADASCANAGAARARAVQSALAISVFWITVRLLVRPRRIRGAPGRLRTGVDRKRAAEGKCVSARGDLRGRRLIQINTTNTEDL